MKSVVDDFQSGPLLSKAIAVLSKSLDVPFESQPSDPTLGFFNAALSVIFFSRCILNEMLEDRRLDLSGTNAIRFAVSIADYPSAAKLLQGETKEILEEDPEYLSTFLAEIREMMEERKLGPDWLALIDL